MKTPEKVLDVINVLYEEHKTIDYNWRGFPFIFRTKNVHDRLPEFSYNQISLAIVELMNEGSVIEKDFSRWNEYGLTYTLPS